MKPEEIAKYLSGDPERDRKATDIAACVEQMREGAAHFFFLKTNGDTREAWGTTDTGFVNKHWTPSPTSRRKEPKGPGSSAFFDLQKLEWRSFNWSRFIRLDRDYCI